MRKALNDNPTVQIAVVAGLLVVMGLMFMFVVKKPKEESGAPPATGAAAAGAPAAAGTSAPVATGSQGTAAAPAAPAAPATSGTPSVSSGTVTPEALIPGPGLPAPVMSAWKRGDAIVLLIRGHGVDDNLVNRSVALLSADKGVAVFVAKANQVARYSRITQGVGVNRVPALVVVRPRKVSGATPQAQVSYGFRNAESVAQAVRDALYTGPDDLPYSPG
jgi:hypothetical protein